MSTTASHGSPHVVRGMGLVLLCPGLLLPEDPETIDVPPARTA